MSRDNAFLLTPVPCFSYYSVLWVKVVQIAHTSRIHGDFKETHRQVLFVCLFLTNYQICNFYLCSFLNLSSMSSYLMVPLSLPPLSHFTKERYVSNSSQGLPWYQRSKNLLETRQRHHWKYWCRHWESASLWWGYNKHFYKVQWFLVPCYQQNQRRA